MNRNLTEYVFPVLWAALGWGLAVALNQLSQELALYWAPAIHIDELIIGILAGSIRFVYWEWRREQIYASRKLEIDMASALQVLRHSTDEPSKTKALEFVTQALMHRPFHPEFVDQFEEFRREQ